MDRRNFLAGAGRLARSAEDDPLPRIRTLVVTDFHMLDDLIRHALATRTEFELLPPIGNLAEMPAQLLQQQHPDLVVVRLRHGEDNEIAQAIHKAAPTAIVVIVASNLQSACLHPPGGKPDEFAPFNETTLAERISRLIGRA